MNKAERLFNLVTLLRSRRTAITAEAIASVMETSVRTVYRDIRALTLSGVPITSEAGIGYFLRADHRLPPLMFTPSEVLALVAGARMVQAFTDPGLAMAARQSEQKIRSILPEQLKLRIERQPYRIPIVQRDDALREVHGQLRLACESHTKIQATYLDECNIQTQRILWPLGMIGWSGRWTLLAWCELRDNYRNFRLDRFQQLTCLDERFTITANISIRHYFEVVLKIKDFG